MNPILVLPSEKYKESFLEALSEQSPEQESPVEGESYQRFNGDFNAFLSYLKNESEGVQMLEGRVPQTVYWLVKGERFIGRISIRHYLNDHLRNMGGHIGYSIRPSEREKGYGSLMLTLALPKAKALGIDPALITCNETNVASKRIIEKHGGVPDVSFVTPEGVTKLRFWVPTS
ncbi:MAG: GNAT family N-acetyltransferase [bacterium]